MGPAASSTAAGSSDSASPAKVVPQPGDKIVYYDSLEELDCKLLGDVNTLAKMVIPKLKEATAKDARSKFLTDCVRDLHGKLSLAEAENLQKLCKEAQTK